MCDKNDFPIFMAITIVCATVSLAELASANIVGYTTTPIEGNKWYMIGTQFKGVGQGNSVIPVNQLCNVTGVDAVPFETRNNGLQIQVYNGSGYTTYFYISNATGATGPCWTNSRRPLADSVTVNLGSAFWLKTPASVAANASATIAGEVKTDATTASATVGESEWTQVACPFPVDLTMGMISTEGLTPGTFADRNNAPQIQVYNGSGYTTYFYISDATEATAPCWTNSRRPLAETATVAAAGKGFWVKASMSGTLTFTMK